MRKVSESLVETRARIEELSRTERVKRAVGLAVSTHVNTPFTLRWLQRQVPDRDGTIVSQALELFRRNGWVRPKGNTPQGTALWVMDEKAARAWEAYDHDVNDIVENGIDPLVEVRLYLRRHGIKTEVLEEGEVQYWKVEKGEAE